jgi:RNA polymerase sigma factor (sigma-70 family)
MNAARPAEILRHLEQSGPTDAELLARFVASKDAGAFAELVRRHGSLVLGVCRRVAGHPQDAEDAFQAVFLVLAQKAGAITNAALLGNWLYGVAFRVALRAKRSAVRRRTREVPVAVLPDPPAPEPPMVMPELTPILDEELAALAACYRDAIILCDLRGATREEAAAALGIPEGTLSSRLATGRKKLAARLTKRGVALSAAALPMAITEAQAAVTVPNELLTKTSGLVADWVTVGAVPGSLARLAEGGFTVRKLLVLGVVMVVGVAGAVFAAQPRDNAPPVEPPKPPMVVAEKPEAPPKEEPKPAATYTNAPRLRAATDVDLFHISRSAWSNDGRFFVLDGVAKDGAKQVSSTVLFAFHKGEFLPLFSRGGTAEGEPVGFSPDSRVLISEKREYHLVSGFHWLRYESLPEDVEKALKDGYKPKARIVDLDLPETRGYAFSADMKTFRTVACDGAQSGDVTKIEVLEVDAATGKSVKSLLKLDLALDRRLVLYGGCVMSANGKRLAAFEKGLKRVTVYDIDRGRKLSTTDLTEPSKSLLEAERPVLVLSPDGRRLAACRGPDRTQIINADTGEALPELEGAKQAAVHPDAHAFSGDGRLLAAVVTPYKLTTVPPRGQFGVEQTSVKAESRVLAVWDTRTGKALKTWRPNLQYPAAPRVAFNPARPLLAVLEPNGQEKTRLGFWDFSAEVEKK